MPRTALATMFLAAAMGRTLPSGVASEAGVLILLAANHPTLTAAELRARILDNAAMGRFFGGRIDRDRFLDVAAAVGP